MAVIEGNPKSLDMFDVIDAGEAKHVDKGVTEYFLRDGFVDKTSFYVDEFVYKGESYIVMMPSAMIDACLDPVATRGRLMEVWINGLTGLTSDLTGNRKP